jgi:hypothetical protein
MDHEWVRQSPDELRRQARKLQVLAAFVHRQETARHLRDQAASLIAEAELKAPKSITVCFRPKADIRNFRTQLTSPE